MQEFSQTLVHMPMYCQYAHSSSSFVAGRCSTGVCIVRSKYAPEHHPGRAAVTRSKARLPFVQPEFLVYPCMDEHFLVSYESQDQKCYSFKLWSLPSRVYTGMCESPHEVLRHVGILSTGDSVMTYIHLRSHRNIFSGGTHTTVKRIRCAFQSPLPTDVVGLGCAGRLRRRYRHHVIAYSMQIDIGITNACMTGSQIA